MYVLRVEGGGGGLDHTMERRSMIRRPTMITGLVFGFALQTIFLATPAETGAQAERASPGAPHGSDMKPQEAHVAVYDPTRQSPAEMMWQPYPASPPAGFHWQHTGSPAVKVDPATGQPLSGQPVGSWILVRDGYSMPKVR